jgi:acetolactate synthase-1/2/3 large subunit
MFDQAGLLREVVKWDYELRDASHLEDLLDRALTVSSAAPRGPSYLTLPREVLAMRSSVAATAATPRSPVPTEPRGDLDAVARLAEKLAHASMPVIVSSASGADPATVEALSLLCDRYAIAYAEEQARYLSLPGNHPLHLGFTLAPILREADVLCFLETDVPWIPARAQPRDDSFIAHCGIDPIFADYPIRSHRSDLSIVSSSAGFIRDLDEALHTYEQNIDPERRSRLSGRARELRTNLATPPSTNSISKEAVSAAVAEVAGPQSVIFNEYWASPAHLGRILPRTYFYLPPSGGLGWALPAALGAKQASPERTMIALVGDGTYIFANPAACHHASAQYGLPTLTVVYNNARWGAVDYASNALYPQGLWRTGDGPSLSDLGPIPAFEQYIEASGGYGERVSVLADLVPVLRRALSVVENENRQALVNVVAR